MIRGAGVRLLVLTILQPHPTEFSHCLFWRTSQNEALKPTGDGEASGSTEFPSRNTEQAYLLFPNSDWSFPVNKELTEP
jgi:hypothetical protein